ncbi:peptidoglycan recognition protein [Streptomyces sp. NPDC004267]|uniref:peptidoglycan recognition protein family protein n=1 Tax=Streptomyces sp. NPDC004267 TaxID=3364694 RepID=UPI003677ED87
MRSGRRARRKTGTRVRRTAVGAALAGVTVLAFQAAANGAVFGNEDDKGSADTPSLYSAQAGRASSRPSQIHRLGLTDKGNGEAILSRRGTEPFGLLGVTWANPHAHIKGTIEARTRSIETGKWSDWIELEPQPAGMDGVRTGAPGSTEPKWVGPSDGAEVRISDGAAAGTLPRGLTLNLVDPSGAGAEAKKNGGLDTEPVAFAADDPPTTPPTTPGPASTAPQPRVVTRAEWGVDESTVTEPAIYLPDGSIKAAFVHHTDSAPYECSQSASVVKSILDYHMKVEGWRDIGYNFLVDKCGTIFEGRKGGIDQPVYGAHTYGWNAQSTGVAVIGNYMQEGASNAALAAVSKIIAYKLGQYGVDPAGKATLTAGATQTVGGKQFTLGQTYEFNAISGHRDGYATACPGDQLYPQLSTIRSYATGSVTGLAISGLAGGATKAGSGYETTGPVTVNWSTSTSSDLIHRFEVLVDDQVAATTAGGARGASVTVSGYGDHRVAVRATHTSGKVTTSPAVTVTVPGPKTLHPVAPKRLMNTIAGVGVPKAKVGAGQEVVLDIAGVDGIPASRIGAVVLNVTATNPTTSGYVSVYPNGTARPTTSNLNFKAGVSIPNLVVVPVVDGKVRFYNHAGTVDLLADLTGYYLKDDTGSTFAPTGPARIMNTLAGVGVPKAKIGPAATVSLQVTGTAGIPSSGVTAVVMNVTATNPTTSGYVSVFPSGTVRPTTSNLNFRAGQSIPNLVIVPVGADGKISFYNHAGTVDLLGDITGYFTTDSTEAKHINIGPMRVMNTMAGLGAPKAPVGAQQSVTLKVAGVNGIPASGVKAVVINVTATNPTNSGWVSVYPSDQVRPPVSNLNFTAGLTIPNLVVVPVSADGKISFYNHAGTVDLLGDITGYFLK